jgi:hypothetical protein
VGLPAHGLCEGHIRRQKFKIFLMFGMLNHVCRLRVLQQMNMSYA